MIDTKTDTVPGPFRDMNEVRNANAASSSPLWFTPSTMRWFRSRVAPGLIAGRYFVTSEQAPTSSGEHYVTGLGERLYTVRVAHDDGTIGTVGDFQAYETLRQARAAARRIADDQL